MQNTQIEKQVEVLITLDTPSNETLSAGIRKLISNPRDNKYLDSFEKRVTEIVNGRKRHNDERGTKEYNTSQTLLELTKSICDKQRRENNFKANLIKLMEEVPVTQKDKTSNEFLKIKLSVNEELSGDYEDKLKLLIKDTANNFPNLDEGLETSRKIILEICKSNRKDFEESIEALKRSFKKLLEDLSQYVNQYMRQDLSEKVNQYVSQYVSQYVRQEVSQKVSQRVSQKVCEYEMKKVSQGLIQYWDRNVSQKVKELSSSWNSLYKTKTAHKKSLLQSLLMLKVIDRLMIEERMKGGSQTVGGGDLEKKIENIEKMLSKNSQLQKMNEEMEKENERIRNEKAELEKQKESIRREIEDLKRRSAESGGEREGARPQNELDEMKKQMQMLMQLVANKPTDEQRQQMGWNSSVSNNDSRDIGR